MAGKEGATREEERIPALDVLRGIAILGILPVNILSFGLPAAALEGKVHFMSPARTEALAVGITSAVFQLKFITIFSMLFGAGLALQHARAAPGFYPRTLWRLALLAGIGLVHALALWYGDILFQYACFGALALALVWVPPRIQLLLGALLLAIPVLMCLWVGFVMDSLGGAGGPSALSSLHMAGPQTLAEAMANPGAGGDGFSTGVGAEVQAYRSGTYGDMFTIRVKHWVTMLVAVAILFSWRLGGTFLLGMAFFRLGLLTPGPQERRWLVYALVVGLTIGGSLELGQGILRAGPPLPMGRLLFLEAIHHVSSLLLALAYASAVLLLPALWIARAPCAWFGNVGRLALSNYLGQTLLCTTFFYGYGLGRFATLTRLQLLALCLAVWAVQLLLSALWMRWFVMGPIEWAWRSLTWGRVEPLRRRPKVTAPASSTPGSAIASSTTAGEPPPPASCSSPG